MTQEKLPIAVSADGKRNAQTLACEPLGFRTFYAMCVKKISQVEGDDITADGEAWLSSSYPDCYRAISAKRCTALAMRWKEQEQGHAIHFIERRAPALEAPGGMLERAKSVLTKAKPPAPTKPVETVASFNEGPKLGDYADAINIAIAKQPAKVEAAPVELPKALPGETLLQMAQRILKEKGRTAS